MTIEEKIKKIDRFFDNQLKLPDIIDVDWKDTQHFEIHTKEDYFWLILNNFNEFSDKTENGKRLGLVLDCFEAYPKLLEILKSNLEVIKELQAENQAHEETIRFLGKENNALKAQVDRVRDLIGLCEIIAPIRTREVSSYIAQAIQNYILGGEGGK